MKLKKFTPGRAVTNLTSKANGIKGYLYPDGRFTNGFLWLELPTNAAEKARARANKLFLETEDLPSIGRAIVNYRQGQPTEAELVRFYYDGMRPDYTSAIAMRQSAQWYAEFAVNGTIYSYKADYVLALEYAAGMVEDVVVEDGTTITNKRINIDKWLIFTESEKPVLEAWNGHCIGGVFPFVRQHVSEGHWKGAE